MSISGSRFDTALIWTKLVFTVRLSLLKIELSINSWLYTDTGVTGLVVLFVYLMCVLVSPRFWLITRPNLPILTRLFF